MQTPIDFYGMGQITQESAERVTLDASLHHLIHSPILIAVYLFDIENNGKTLLIFAFEQNIDIDMAAEISNIIAARSGDYLVSPPKPIRAKQLGILLKQLSPSRIEAFVLGLDHPVRFKVMAFPLKPAILKHAEGASVPWSI